MSLGHISNSLPLALETIMILVSMMTWHQMELRCHSRFRMRIWNCVRTLIQPKFINFIYHITCQTWLCKSDILGIGYGSFPIPPVIRLKRIYNFWCSMMILCWLTHVLVALYIIFMHFLGLTYYKMPQCQFRVFYCFSF